MSFIIFGDSFTFPEGDAATNRVHTYAKGFYENGISVHVICFGSDYNTDGDGMFNGIYYYHPFGQRKRSKYFIVRRWQKFIKYFKTFTLIRRISKNDNIISFNCWTQLLTTQLFAFILAKYFKTKIILERNEHPLRNYQGSFIRKINGEIRLYFVTMLTDGIFCISRYLVDFFKNKGFPSKGLFHVPSTVDPSSFLEAGEAPFPFNYIGYFGALTFWRDNIDLLIRAFAKISNEHHNLHLVLGGYCSIKEKKQILDLIVELKMVNKVILLNYIGRQEIINYITHAHILVMVRSANLASQASFPSKLTEFLATSVPVITVNVGEISDYLTDGVNAFIIKPEDIDALAEKLTFVLNNYQFAKVVALKGKELTDTIFNYKFQAKRMIEYLNSLS